MSLDKLVSKIRSYTPFVTPEYELYVVNGLYCRFGANTLRQYKFKFPNYFKNQENIKKDTPLKDFYYEIFNNQNCAFRISFELV